MSMTDSASHTPMLWFDGALHPKDAPLAPLTTHALHYGSGVFEGMRSYATANGAAVFRMREHFERMQRGCELLAIDFDIERAEHATREALRANQHRDAYIRPLAWCGSGSIGLDVADLSHHLMVATFPTVVHLSGSHVRLAVSPWRRNPASSLPPLKLCGAYVNSLLAKAEAKRRGFHEALFVDGDGMGVECTGANVFMLKDGKVTAVEHADALPGITRDTLMTMTGAESRAVSLAELREADEIFVCGTAAEISPIAALDDRSLPSQKYGQELLASYKRVVRGEDASYRHWLSDV